MVSAAAGGEGVLAAGGWLAALSPDPLPDLRLATWVSEDDEVLEGALGDLALNLATDRILGDVVVDAGIALVDGEPRLLRNGIERIVPLVDADDERLRAVVVPTQSLDEETRKIENL